MDDLIKKLINLGVVTLKINGTETTPCNFQQNQNGSVSIDSKLYSIDDNIVIKSINLKKLKSILKTFDTIISLSGSDEIDEIGFNRIRAIDVLRNLDKSKNDFERLDQISSIIKEKQLFEYTSFLNPNNNEEADMEEFNYEL